MIRRNALEARDRRRREPESGSPEFGTVMVM